MCVYDTDFDSGADFVACGFACHPYEGIDLENTILEMGVAERLVEAVASEQKLTASGGAEQVVDKARQAVAPLSSLRRANAVKQWGLPFDQVDLDKYIREDGSLDTDKYLRILLQKRPASASSAPPSVQDLQIAAQGSCATGLYRGRDILQILAKYLRMTFLRQKKNMGASPEALEAMVHVAASSVLALTEWAAELQRITGSKRMPAQ
ncbi:hypothetical protein [Ornithinimicrobium cerasi]|uniref:hypothetical protein n=1 Tax=Ornithinimicrobium cerasi TaxID=2248773 RepID=UPI00137AC71C|nr:hypothetical protein [Ornithinimicrobium cerasi]